MANIKRVSILGEIPFDAGESDAVLRHLGKLSLPSIGLKCVIDRNHFGMRPNKYNGRTAMHRFTITGEEAVSNDYLKKIIRDFSEAGGSIYVATSIDIENNEGIVDLLK
jgi:hypothetical protein